MTINIKQKNENDQIQKEIKYPDKDFIKLQNLELGTNLPSERKLAEKI